MKLCAILPVRNEDWCLGLTLRSLLMWVDVAVLSLHECTDDTRAIIQEVARDTGQVLSSRWGTQEWMEMQQRQSLLHDARSLGATHIVTLDADEILTGNLLPTIRGMVEAMLPGRILQLPGYNLRGGLARYHANGIWGNRWFSTAFQDASHLGWTGDRYHQRTPQGAPLADCSPVPQGKGGVMHLWGASERRLKAKHRAYRIQETLRWPKKDLAQIESMYSLAEHGTGAATDCPNFWKYSEVPPGWWEPYTHLMPYLHVDAVPWQEAWCDEMIALHGRERFAGLTV